MKQIKTYYDITDIKFHNSCPKVKLFSRGMPRHPATMFTVQYLAYLVLTGAECHTFETLLLFDLTFLLILLFHLYLSNCRIYIPLDIVPYSFKHQTLKINKTKKREKKNIAFVFLGI